MRKTPGQDLKMARHKETKGMDKNIETAMFTGFVLVVRKREGGKAHLNGVGRE